MFKLSSVRKRRTDTETASSVWPGPASNLLSCFNLPSARTAGVNYHSWIPTALRCTMNNKESNSRHPRAGNIVGHLFLGYTLCN